MNCEEVVRLLSDYLDQELDEELSAELRQHVRTCQNCRVVLDSTQKTILLYHDMEKRTISLSRRSELFERIQRVFEKGVTTERTDESGNQGPKASHREEHESL